MLGNLECSGARVKRVSEVGTWESVEWDCTFVCVHACVCERGEENMRNVLLTDECFVPNDI